MANVIKHTHGDIRVQPGDLVVTPYGERAVTHTTYSGRQGARVWTEAPSAPGDDWREPEPFAASECGCYVTSED